jgi:hypothetical protein
MEGVLTRGAMVTVPEDCPPTTGRLRLKSSMKESLTVGPEPAPSD